MIWHTIIYHPFFDILLQTPKGPAVLVRKSEEWTPNQESERILRINAVRGKIVAFHPCQETLECLSLLQAINGVPLVEGRLYLGSGNDPFHVKGTRWIGQQKGWMEAVQESEVDFLGDATMGVVDLAVLMNRGAF